MEKTGKAVAWICLLGTLCVGCYSTELIRPTAAEREKICTGRIDYVRTKDWRKHEFVEPPVVANDAIVGRKATSFWTTEEFRIPLSDVEEVSVSRFNTGETLIWVGALSATIAITAAIVANNPPRIY
jgi:hypothetical protein